MPLITFNPLYKGHRAMVVKRDKALAIQAAHQSPTGDMSEEQLEMLACIEHIYIAQDKPRPAAYTEHLTHKGVEQGKNMALPTGDR